MSYDCGDWLTKACSLSDTYGTSDPFLSIKYCRNHKPVRKLR